jgi:hypothetical protein
MRLSTHYGTVRFIGNIPVYNLYTDPVPNIY